MSKYILFASQKNRDLGFRGMVYHLIFLFESSRLLNHILSFKKFTSRTYYRTAILFDKLWKM